MGSTRNESSAPPSPHVATTASCTLSPESDSTPETVASKPGRSRGRDLDPPLACGRCPRALRAATRDTGAALRRKRLEQRSLTRDVGGVLGEKVRARRTRDAFGDGRVVARQRASPRRAGARRGCGRRGPVRSGCSSAASTRSCNSSRRDLSHGSSPPSARVSRYNARARSGRSRWVASANTRSSSKPSTRWAAARSRLESPTSSAISCSAAAPRSSRPASRRARSTGVASSPAVSRMSAASSSHSGCCSRAYSAAARSSVATRSRIVSTSEKRSTCDGSIRNGSSRRRRTASASSGSARSSTPVVSRNRHVRASPERSTSNSRAGRVAVPPHRRVAEVTQVVEQRAPGLHVAPADRLGGFERE